MTLRLPDNIQRIDTDGKVIFFNPDIPSWVVTDANGATLLSLCDGTLSADAIVELFDKEYGPEAACTVRRFLDYAIDARLFDTAPASEVPILRSDDTLGIIQLSISASCNLNCRYCYATDRVESQYPRMTLADYRRIVDEACAMSQGVKFTLTGGEPLLNADCLAIAEYIKQQGHYVDLLTNGTLIDEHNAARISALFDMVTISLDGSTRQLHEAFRGPNTYDRTERAIRLLEEHGTDTRLSMTVNRLNISDVPSMARKWGSQLSFAPLFPAGNARDAQTDLSITGREYYEALHSADGVNPLSYCESSLDASQVCRNCKCALGDGELSLSPTGDVYPCQLLHYPEFHIGNIHERSLRELYEQSEVVEQCRHLTVDNIQGCSTCFLKYICGGACRARAYHECGDIRSSGPFCEYERQAFIDGIRDIYSHNKMDM